MTVFHVRASYGDEAQRIVQQLRQLGTPKVAMFYRAHAGGKSITPLLRRGHISAS
jgi:hypothetical protein